MSYGEIIVSVLIIALVCFATWRLGQANPIGTGRLARRMTQLEVRVRASEASREAAFRAVDSRLDEVDVAVKKLTDTTGATNTAIGAMRLEAAGDRGVSERTWAAVDRIQNFFLDQALEQAFGRDKRP